MVMDNPLAQQGLGHVLPVWGPARGWLMSPAAWLQFFVLLAARCLVRDIIRIPFLKAPGRYELIPVAAIHALHAIWNALKGAGIEIPYPHRVVDFKGAVPA